MTIGVRAVRILALACTLGVTSLVSAQPARPPVVPPPGHIASETDRDQARRFALEGITASRRADWATVLDRFQQAERLFDAPIHLQYMARAYEALGHIREAADTWRRLTHEVLAPDAPQVFREAIAESQREYPRLRARLGEITITASNPPADAQVSLDGQPLGLEALSAGILVDPGTHHITAHAAGQPDIDRAVTLSLGGTESVNLPFVVPPVVEEAPPPPPPPRTTTVYTANPLRTAGIITAGAGGLLLASGLITGLIASGDYSSLQTACPNYQCATASQLGQRDTVSSLATTTNVLLVTGAIVAVVGTVIAIVSGPKAHTITVASLPGGMDFSVHF